MKNIKARIKQISPQILLDCMRKVKLLFKKSSYIGTFTEFGDVKYEGVWEDDHWLEISRLKLENLPDNIDGYRSVIFSIIDNMSIEETCKVLDFGGGTGFIYHSIRSFFTNKENVYWDIVDNERLISIGKKYSNKNPNIGFFISLPNINSHYDVVYMNTTLQYIENYQEVLLKLKKYEPKYFVFTRLLAGNIDTFITCQNINGKKIPCMFLNINELIFFMEKNNYKLFKRIPCIEESFAKSSFKKIPSGKQIKNSVNIIFCQK